MEGVLFPHAVVEGREGLKEYQARGGYEALAKAVLKDKDPIVRHESAAALGSVGSSESEEVLTRALSDEDELVRNSARASLFNIKFLKQYSAGSTARERAPRP